ncbi:MAG: hypothetical protein ACQEWV_06635 [Bacillota bacterium]
MAMNKNDFDYNKYLDWNFRTQGPHVPDKNISLGIANFMRKYMSKSEWTGLDIQYNIHGDWYLKEFMNQTRLTYNSFRKILRDYSRRNAFTLELDKLGIRVKEVRGLYSFYDFKEEGHEMDPGDKETLEKFIGMIKNSGSIRVNIWQPDIEAKKLNVGKVDLVEVLERYEEKIKEAGIKIVRDLNLEEYKTYSFVG